MGKPANSAARALVADIGGTNARFALADLETLKLSEIRQFLCAEHPSIESAAQIYLAGLKERPCRGAAAVAAPLAGSEIKLTNSVWSFTVESLARAASLDDILLLNDFEALALSLPHLHAEELHQIGGGVPAQQATKVVLGPRHRHRRRRPRLVWRRLDRGAERGRSHFARRPYAARVRAHRAASRQPRPSFRGARAVRAGACRSLSRHRRLSWRARAAASAQRCAAAGLGRQRSARRGSAFAVRHLARSLCRRRRLGLLRPRRPLRGIDFEKMKPTSFA
jgi:Glucokinase